MNLPTLPLISTCRQILSITSGVAVDFSTTADFVWVISFNTASTVTAASMRPFEVVGVGVQTKVSAGSLDINWSMVVL